MKIALAFDSKLAREGIAELLRRYDFTITEELSCTQLAEATDLELNADVIVMNVDDFTEFDPAELIFHVRNVSPKLKIVLIGGPSSDHTWLQRCIESGAHGYITDEAPAEALAQYVQLASQGLTAMPPSISRVLRGESGAQENPMHVNGDLSVRERHVLGRIANGDPNKVIAKTLEISESTVKAHLKSILRKIGVKNRTQAAIWAFNNGIGTDRPSVGNRPDGD